MRKGNEQQVKKVLRKKFFQKVTVSKVNLSFIVNAQKSKLLDLWR